MKISANRHLIGFQNFVAVADFQTRLIFLIRIFNHQTFLSRNFVNFFFDGFAFFQILIFHSSRNFGQNRKRERIPGREHFIFFNELAVFDVNLRTINYLIARHFASAFVNQCEFRLTLHRNDFIFTVFDDFQINVFDSSVHRRRVFGFLFEPRRAADVKGSHRQLRSGFTD